MKIWKSLLIVLIIVANLAFAQPSFADRPKFSKNPDYIEVTKALNELSQTKEKDAQTQVEGLTQEEIQNRIDELTLQKYALEAGNTWGQCRNETSKTLGVYGKNPKADDDDEKSSYDNELYFLAPGQTTQNKWDCDGIYLPSDVNVANFSSSPNGQGQELTGPAAIKILDGTQLVIKTNPDTAAIELNVPTVKVLNSNTANWFIPNISQALIDTRVPNAPSNQS